MEIMQRVSLFLRSLKLPESVASAFRPPRVHKMSLTIAVYIPFKKEENEEGKALRWDCYFPAIKLHWRTSFSSALCFCLYKVYCLITLYISWVALLSPQLRYTQSLNKRYFRINSSFPFTSLTLIALERVKV